MKADLLQRIAIFLDSHPSLQGRPAIEAELMQAEQTLQLALNEDYCEFVQHFGGAMWVLRCMPL